MRQRPVLLPGVFTDYVFRDPDMLGVSITLTMAIAGVIMLAIFLATMRPYRAHYRMMQEFGNSND